MESNSKEERKLNRLIDRSNKPLLVIQSVFPFDLFPDQILVDQHKIDIIKNTFFATKQIVSVLIKDVSTVNITTSFMFAKVSFETPGYDKKPPAISYLKKEDAMRLKDTVTGLRAAQDAGIKTAEIKTSDLRRKVQKVGEVKMPEAVTS